MNRTYAMLVAAIISCIIPFVANSATAQETPRRHRYVEYRRFITTEAFRRLVSDLALSDAQLAQATLLHKAYSEELIRKLGMLEERMHDSINKLQIKYYPELDPAMDIGNLPEKQRHDIEIARRNVQDGLDILVSNKDYSGELAQLALGNTRAVDEYEEKSRDEMLAGVVQMLSESQQAAYPRALSRLMINLHAFSPAYQVKDPLFQADPVFNLDIIGVLSESAEHELQKWSPAIATIQVGATDKTLEEVSQKMEDFEQQYCAEVRQWEETFAQRVSNISAAKRNAKESLAEGFWRQELGRRRLMFTLRGAFVDDLASLAKEHIGQDAGSSLVMRFREATCPSLYSEDSADRMILWMSEVLDADSQELKQGKAAYELYKVSRQPVRDEAFAAIIQNYCTGNLTDGHKSTNENARLRAINKQRIALAVKATDSFRAILPDGYKEAFDEELKHFRAELLRSVDPRP